jgi:hypothetical protein
LLKVALKHQKSIIIYIYTAYSLKKTNSEYEGYSRSSACTLNWYLHFYFMSLASLSVCSSTVYSNKLMSINWLCIWNISLFIKLS